MFLSADARRYGVENTPIVLAVQKMPQGQVLSPHVISLRGSFGARKLSHTVEKTSLSQVKTLPKQQAVREKEPHVFVEPEEDEILSSIESLFRGKNARVAFPQNTDLQENRHHSVDTSQSIYKIPSQQEQFQRMRAGKKGFIRSLFD